MKVSSIPLLNADALLRIARRKFPTDWADTDSQIAAAFNQDIAHEARIKAEVGRHQPAQDVGCRLGPPRACAVAPNLSILFNRL